MVVCGEKLPSQLYGRGFSTPKEGRGSTYECVLLYVEENRSLWVNLMGETTSKPFLYEGVCVRVCVCIFVNVRVRVFACFLHVALLET